LIPFNYRDNNNRIQEYTEYQQSSEWDAAKASKQKHEHISFTGKVLHAKRMKPAPLGAWSATRNNAPGSV
jgi:hypothetical protein